MKRVAITAAFLLLLWGASLGLSYVPLGAASLAIALAVAAMKAALVAGVFMELFRERASIKIAFASSLALAAILGGLTVADVVTRP